MGAWVTTVIYFANTTIFFSTSMCFDVWKAREINVHMTVSRSLGTWAVGTNVCRVVVSKTTHYQK